MERITHLTPKKSQVFDKKNYLYRNTSVNEWSRNDIIRISSFCKTTPNQTIDLVIVYEQSLTTHTHTQKTIWHYVSPE